MTAHRNPSTAPTIGLRAKSVRQRGPTSPLAYATGVAKNQSWTRKGSACRTSRYATFSADSHRPVPSAAVVASSTNAGSHTIRHVT